MSNYIKKIAVFTGTRAEYGLLYWLLKDFQADDNFHLQLIVTGSHLSPEFGETWKQIEDDGFKICQKVEMLLSSNTALGVVKSMGLGMIGFADVLETLKPDLVVVLGDRYEALAMAQTAFVMNIPIAHLHGGERTDGAYDDAIRHAITKLATLHFSAAEPYRKRIIQMGENPERVFNVGALGLEHLSRMEFLSRVDCAKALNFNLVDPFFLCTYHPETLSNKKAISSFEAIMSALEDYPEYQLVITYPNADNESHSIIKFLNEYQVKNAKRLCVKKSLGSKLYLSLMKHAIAVIGNSSSGIIEAPAFEIPTINIGSRQNGRLSAASILHCEPDVEQIKAAIQKLKSSDFMHNARKASLPYGRGNSSKEIIEVLKSLKSIPVKSFYDLEFKL